VVQFFTNLGRIDPTGTTTNGIARVRLVADSRSGTATVVAISGGGGSPSTDSSGGGVNRDEVPVTIGNLNAVEIFVTADPPSISVRGSSYITANVFDEFGNPVHGAPVFFSIEQPTTPPSPGPTRDSLDSGGAARFTDNDGRAFDVLRANRQVAGTITVKARVPGGESGMIEGTVVVTIQ
jgi:hypothetical protein